MRIVLTQVAKAPSATRHVVLADINALNYPPAPDRIYSDMKSNKTMELLEINIQTLENRHFLFSQRDLTKLFDGGNTISYF